MGDCVSCLCVTPVCHGSASDSIHIGCGNPLEMIVARSYFVAFVLINFCFPPQLAITYIKKQIMSVKDRKHACSVLC